MKKRVLCLLSIMFFGILLFGTFFHKQIDDCFRIHVATVYGSDRIMERETVVDIAGVPTQVTVKDSFLMLPKTAVKDDKIYVVETVKVPYGSYEIVHLQNVETKNVPMDAEAGAQNILITAGLSRSDKVVTVFDERLQDGMRIKVSDK